MTIAVVWDTPERNVIRWDFAREWNQQDLYDAEQATDSLLVEVSDTVVDLVLNMNETSTWPQDAFTILKNVLKITSRGTGVKIIVGANSLTQKLLKAFSKHDRPFVEGLTFVTNLQEARELLLK